MKNISWLDDYLGLYTLFSDPYQIRGWKKVIICVLPSTVYTPQEIIKDFPAIWESDFTKCLNIYIQSSSAAVSLWWKLKIWMLEYLNCIIDNKPFMTKDVFFLNRYLSLNSKYNLDPRMNLIFNEWWMFWSRNVSTEFWSILVFE